MQCDLLIAVRVWTGLDRKLSIFFLCFRPRCCCCCYYRWRHVSWRFFVKSIIFAFHHVMRILMASFSHRQWKITFLLMRQLKQYQQGSAKLFHITLCCSTAHFHSFFGLIRTHTHTYTSLYISFVNATRVAQQFQNNERFIPVPVCLYAPIYFQFT